jgi:hypothetical protein
VRRGPRSLDPVRVGTLECRAWQTYYQRKWGALLVTSVALVRAGFGMDWWRTLQGAWFVLRANQLWAPYPDNDPDGARRCMRRFYRLVSEASGQPVDTAKAAELEVEWWRAHREAQHTPDGSRAEVVEALVELYAFLYGVELGAVRPAAELRTEAMVVSDRWVAEGCDDANPLLAEERALLVRSFAALLAAVHR